MIMNFLGIDFEVKCIPKLDETFIPMAAFNKAFLKTAKKPISIAIERNDRLVSVYDTYIHGTMDKMEVDQFYIERLVKFLLFAKGGWKVTICGDQDIALYIAEVYSDNGLRNYDYNIMSKIYEKKFEVISMPYDQKPVENEHSLPLGRHLNGCRIGFDAGGSDRKVSAVFDGEVVYSEEVVWHPKMNADPDYHYKGIVSAFKTAASYLPKVDAIGVSSAGTYINNRVMSASLFIKVPDEIFNQKVKNIYMDAAKEIGDVPVVVVNDGDVTALAGTMELNDNNVLGIAMGTSEAAGYIDEKGNITGWLNELAFAPVDAHPDAMADEWSGDKGCGVKYFSQDAIIKLAPKAGIALSKNLSPAEKLKEVQNLFAEFNPCATKIYETIGCYLGHTLAYYAMFYDIKHVLLLGRVMSGGGGDIILKEAKRVLQYEYPDVDEIINLHLPDERIRRLGQCIAAASLPENKF
jgi:predicted NBD/HSP70 family sugar kinase